jgi:phosphatidylethanolamine-binding protein (PEBP) family uncharacterized protein
MSEREHHPDHSGQSISIMRVDPIYDTGVLVTCPVQEADGRLPDRHSAYHDNISPPLRWLNAIPEGLGNDKRLITPQGAIQGKNDAGGYGWFGPRPPAGHGVHRYYFQVFALDDWLEMGPDTPLHELLNALKGHTLAKGEMMATYEAPGAQ